MTSPREVLVAVLDDVAEANVPEDLRPIAFQKLWEAHTSGTVAPLATPPAPAPPGAAPSPSAPATSAPAVPGDKLAAIAARSGLDRDVVSEVFDQRGDEIELIIASSKLSNSTSTGAKEVALLVAGSRQAAGDEEWTTLDSVRDSCQEYRKLDSNFARTIQSMTQFNVRKESERKLMLRVSRPGWEEFAKLVSRLAGV